MPQIELPLGLRGSVNLPRTQQGLRNCFSANVDGRNLILGRRGIESISTLASKARGAFVWQDSMYIVSGTSLLKVTNLATGATSTIGTISGVQDIKTSDGHVELVIISKGEKIYTLSTADALVDITANSNFVVCDDVDFINGRFVYIPTSGDPAFYSDVDDAGTVQAASFFDAEELPDKNRAIANLRNTLYIFGEHSIQPFRNVSTAEVFLPIQGARVDNGYLGGLMEYADTLVYIGREKEQSAGIYALKQGFAERLSTERVDSILEGYTKDQLGSAVASRVRMRGYDIATWTLINDAWGFYKGEFFDLDTVVDGDPEPWHGGFITMVDNVYYSTFNKSFGKFAEINTDYGNEIAREILTSFNDPEGRWFSVSSVEIGVSQGLNAAVGSVAVIMSRDNKAFPNPVFRNLGDLAEYDKRLVWRPPGGFGAYQGFCGIKIYTAEDVVFDVDSFVVGLHQ
jgi:hypothetical protein